MFKISVAWEYLTGKLSQSQLAKKQSAYGDYSLLFVHQYKEYYQNTAPAPVAVLPGACLSDSKLEQELHLAKLKITAVKMLIKNAEQELGLTLKKSLASNCLSNEGVLQQHLSYSHLLAF